MKMKWERVTIFISSTFNDMHTERDFLVKNVFPELREWCEKHKIHLQDVDLRWGVKTEDTENANTLKTCLKNIDRSRPFFLCFLGQRRGWTPGKSDISPETLKCYPEILNLIEDAPSKKDILEKLFTHYLRIETEKTNKEIEGIFKILNDFPAIFNSIDNLSEKDNIGEKFLKKSDCEDNGDLSEKEKELIKTLEGFSQFLEKISKDEKKSEEAVANSGVNDILNKCPHLKKYSAMDFFEMLKFCPDYLNINNSSITEIELDHASLNPLERIYKDKDTKKVKQEPCPEADQSIFFIREDNYTENLNKGQKGIYTKKPSIILPAVTSSTALTASKPFGASAISTNEFNSSFVMLGL
jgi:hypothetical protein